MANIKAIRNCICDLKEISQGSSINDLKLKLKTLFHNSENIDDDVDEAINNFFNLSLVKDN